MSDRRLICVGSLAGVFALTFLALFLFIREGADVAKKKEDKLCEAAQAQIAAKDYDAAIATCIDIQPLNAGKAHAIRGKAYELKGEFTLARQEYFASYCWGNHVASASLSRLDKAGAK